MRISVVGAGAVGSFYGALLARAGHEVTLQSVSLSDRASGGSVALSIHSVWQDFRISLPICRFCSELPESEILILSSKFLPGLTQPELILEKIAADGTIIFLQNGIGHEETFEPAAIAAGKHLVAGLAFTCINRGADPTTINHIDYGNILLAPVRSTFTDPDTAVSEIRKLFDAAGIPVSATESHAAARYEKLLWNVPFNGLTALLLCDTLAVMQSARLRSEAESLMHEVLEVARADGHALPPEKTNEMLQRTESMKPYATSMYLDRVAGRAMETDAIFGELIRRAERSGIAVPRITLLRAALEFIGRSAVQRI